MGKFIIVCILILMRCSQGKKSIEISELEGEWWSDASAPSANFAVHDRQIWLDYDSQYHLLKIEKGDVLVYEIGLGVGKIENKIIKLNIDKLILESSRGQKITYVRRN